MNSLLILYELGVLSILLKRKQEFEDYFRSMSNWVQLSENVWLVKTTLDAARVRDDLRSILLKGNEDQNTKIMIIDTKKNAWASYNYPNDINTWLKNYL